MQGSSACRKEPAYFENFSITLVLNIATKKLFFFPSSLIPQKALPISSVSSLSGKCLAFDIF